MLASRLLIRIYSSDLPDDESARDIEALKYPCVQPTIATAERRWARLQADRASPSLSFRAQLRSRTHLL